MFNLISDHSGNIIKLYTSNIFIQDIFKHNIFIHNIMTSLFIICLEIFITINNDI